MALGLANFASVVIPLFYVISAVEAGVTTNPAGVMLAVASALAIAVRLLAGIACDRSQLRPLLLCAGLLATGSFGLLLLASGYTTGMLLGVMLALAGAWGFNGVFWFAVVQAYADVPGRITGVLSPAGSVGATIGALAFGALVAQFGYQLAWAVSALAALLAAVGMSFSGRLLAYRVRLT